LVEDVFATLRPDFDIGLEPVYLLDSPLDNFYQSILVEEHRIYEVDNVINKGIFNDAINKKVPVKRWTSVDF
jgi:hypothetical protein